MKKQLNYVLNQEQLINAADILSEVHYNGLVIPEQHDWLKEVILYQQVIDYWQCGWNAYDPSPAGYEGCPGDAQYSAYVARCLLERALFPLDLPTANDVWKSYHHTIVCDVCGEPDNPKHICNSCLTDLRGA